MPIRKIDKRGVEHYLPEIESMSREELKEYQWKKTTNITLTVLLARNRIF